MRVHCEAKDCFHFVDEAGICELTDIHLDAMGGCLEYEDSTNMDWEDAYESTDN